MAARPCAPELRRPPAGNGSAGRWPATHSPGSAGPWPGKSFNFRHLRTSVEAWPDVQRSTIAPRWGMSSHRLRLGRHSIIGQACVLTTTTHQRRRLFESEAAAACLIDQFHCIERQGLVQSLAWVVMPDHVHWMFELRAAHLPDIARRMKSSSALALNRLAGRRCTVWQSGYFDHAVRAEESLARQALYILGNPVRAGLAEQIGDYPYAWSVWW